MAPLPRKRFGQHWLRSDRTLNQIVAAAELLPQDRVLEIGPGQGVLTQRLLSLVAAVVAVEIDRDLCERLAKQWGSRENFLLLQGDFLTLNLVELLAAFPHLQQPNKVVANIPYNITGPILEKVLGTIAQPALSPYDTIVLLLQKEVAERLCAQPGSKAYGALSVRVQYLATAELICRVPAGAFYPPPKVDSAVVRLRPRTVPWPVNQPRDLDRLVTAGFATRRKMLRNSLSPLIDRDQLSHFLEELKINPQARAEDLSLAQWIALTNAFLLSSGSSQN
ncbi:16S rRNA (adenine(1518)-N(6)/adenine(1519)-N(6))-dimethyltransferase [Leptolyngbya sp. 'hensonii']|uniref:16S rRNA (adenine(1518)-N(6)/adenine(1519)-N(6))- dimethyltransferase RsmA n=1 Tax=Leptolyngbya sp. 'hensonii' TaxID=1922337 RepID=UPI00094FDCBD|nr:16S rRNA (adenine(1518)-N(6)/adenine(1519)-N(6))-dimethyltransferase RsmA [Leptolyngbya sp. 'hensonii']OLP15500.1 16S rRNA (adenine(1518)-N(6)/adenine(1519)-N(6))-dimethyltransferase [Leptolyngbya sp. 'hensonii']